MKIRSGFVSNSSSSSFVIMYVNGHEDHKSKTIDECGDSEEFECTSGLSFTIDSLIKQLEEAKAQGFTQVEIDAGGGYDG